MKIVFLHGLESGPGGHKPTHLTGRGHEVVAPVLPTGPAVEFLKKQRGPLPAEILAPPYEVAKKALEARPDVVVGSSFGGGLGVRLAVDHAWDGPLVLMAPAAGSLVLPARAGRVVIVHGRKDDVVPHTGSVRLAETAGCDVVLWLVDDDHRLKKSVEAGVMDEAIHLAVKGGPAWRASPLQAPS